MPTSASQDGSKLARAVGDAIRRVDRPGWKKFVLALAALSAGFLLAIYSNIFAQRGNVPATALCASLALLLSGYVAVTVVPYLARRTSLEWLRVSIDYQFTREGIVFVCLVFVLAIAGFNTGNNLLYLVVASMLAAILMSGVLSLAVLSGLSLEILLPEHVFARRPVPARIYLENQKKLIPSFSITLHGSDTLDSKSKRRSETSARPQGAIFRQALYFPFLPAARTLTRSVELEFPRRGFYREDGFALSTRFPFGFLEKKLYLEVSRELTVYPAVGPTEQLYQIIPLLSGELESFQKGHGHDLYSIREMNSTDGARHVDWKASARTGALKVREFTREDDRRLLIVFDNRVGPLEERAVQMFEAGVELCARVAWYFYEAGAQLQFYSEGHRTAPEPASEVIYDILRYLAAVKPSFEPPVAAPEVAASNDVFRIIFTAAPRGSIAPPETGRSHVIFLDQLPTQEPHEAAESSSPVSKS